MKYWRPVSVVLFVISVFPSCSTLAPPDLKYFGDAGSAPNTIGRSSQVNFAGLRLSSQDYAKEYEEALQDAFSNAPPGTTKLKNIKGYVVSLDWPKFYGTVVMAGGVAASLSDNPTSRVGGVFVTAFGLVVALVNTYDYVVEAEPVIQ